MDNIVFLIQIEAKTNLIAQTDLFCYSLNKIYPQYKVIVVSEAPIGLSRPNLQNYIIPNKIYPELKQKAPDKYIIAIKRVTYIKEFLADNNFDDKFVILTDPDVAFIRRSNFLDTFNGMTKSILGVGPKYDVPGNTINLFKQKSGGKDFQLYSPPWGVHGSNLKAFIDQWLDVWYYYLNDPELFPKTDKLNNKITDHGNGYLLEMFPPTIIAKQMNLQIIEMFPSYYNELFHYFHNLTRNIELDKYPTNTTVKGWYKNNIDWSREKINPIYYKEKGPLTRDLMFYKLFNEWVAIYKTGAII